MIDYKKEFLEMIYEVGQHQISLPECFKHDVKAAKYLFEKDMDDNYKEIYPDFYDQFSDKVLLHPDIKKIIRIRLKHKRKYERDEFKRSIKELLKERKQLAKNITFEKQQELHNTFETLDPIKVEEAESGSCWKTIISLNGHYEILKRYIYSDDDCINEYIINLKLEKIYIEEEQKAEETFNLALINFK